MQFRRDPEGLSPKAYEDRWDHKIKASVTAEKTIQQEASQASSPGTCIKHTGKRLYKTGPQTPTKSPHWYI